VYAVDASRRRSFVEAISKYWPGVKDAKLTPDYAGVRPKLQPPVASVGANAPREAIVRDTADFAIEGVAVHGVEGLVTLLGIESPGLTSSLAIAEYVETLLLDAAQ
jgi:L-2-hydroxyglutarate oxidase LhgO